MPIDIEEGLTKVNVGDGVELDLYYARPRGGGPFPSVLVIHEIWGLNANIMSIARWLAREGYAAFAPNLYSRPELRDKLSIERIEALMDVARALPPEKRRDPAAIMDIIHRSLSRDKAKEMEGVVDVLVANRQRLEEQAVRDIAAIYWEVDKMGHVARGKIALMGFCMGGYLAFQASTEVPASATIVFYGANPRPIEAIAKIRGPILGIYAGNDPPINSGLPQLIEAVVRFGKDFEMKIYPGTLHGFFNDQRPTHDPRASADAWARVINFLRRTLRGWSWGTA